MAVVASSLLALPAAAQAARTVVAVGDSLTATVDAVDTDDPNARWPDFLQRLLLSSGSTTSIANAGISANQITYDANVVPWGGPSLEHRFDRDVLAVPGLAGVVVLEGINDLGLSHATAARVIAGLTRIADRAHAVHVPIAVGTLTPMKRAFYDLGNIQHERRVVNDWIRSQQVFDAVVDFDAALRDPNDRLALRAAYDSGDHLHPSPTGHQVMAAAIDLRMLRALSGELRPAAPTVTLKRRGGRCSRQIVVRAEAGPGDRLASVRTRITGRRRVIRNEHGLRARTVLRGLPRRRFALDVRVTSAAGVVARRTRRFGDCRIVHPATLRSTWIASR